MRVITGHRPLMDTPMTSYDVEGTCVSSRAPDLEFLGGLVAPVDHIRHVRREDKRDTVTLDASEPLDITQEAAKVNVEHAPVACHHDVVIVTIANSCHRTRTRM